MSENTHDEQVKIALYQRYPELYCMLKLGVKPWKAQVEILHAIRDNQQVMAIASHGVGKSTVAAMANNWWFDCFRNSKALVTGPTQYQVDTIIFGEIRKQRALKNLEGLKPSAPEMERHANWWCKGRVAAKGDTQQGVHDERLLITFEEAVAIPTSFWISAKGMCVYNTNRWFSIMNPTDISSEAYHQWASNTWKKIQISAMDHPNVIAELQGKPMPIPGAVTKKFIDDMIISDTERLSANDSPNEEIDVEWPPKSGIWYKPNGVFEGRVLGRWPTQAISSIWNMSSWEKAIQPKDFDDGEETQIGCDIAREGDDYTEIFVRRGKTALHYEKHNGWALTRTAGRLMEIAREWASKNIDGSERTHEDPQDIKICIDHVGMGSGITDMVKEAGFKAIPEIAQAVALKEDQYPDRRSELWFNTRQLAIDNNIDLSRLPSEVLEQLQNQLFSQTWEPDSKGRRKCRPKKEIKAKLKRSPDTADAFNLAYAASSLTDYRLPSGASISITGKKSVLYNQDESDDLIEKLLNSQRRDQIIRRRTERASREDLFFNNRDKGNMYHDW